MKKIKNKNIKEEKGLPAKKEGNVFKFKLLYAVLLFIIGVILVIISLNNNAPVSETLPLETTSAINTSPSPTQNTSQTNTSQTNETIPVSESKQEEKPRNIKIKVVKFEPNNPCEGCTNLGNFAKETIQRHFPEEYESGQIIYETVNYQDSKNIEIVKKYNVVSSSLYIIVIKDGREEVIDANDMWNYVWDKEKYIEKFKFELEKIKNK